MAKIRVSEAQSSRMVAAQVAKDDVDRLRQTLEHLPSGIAAQIQRNAPLAAIQRLEQERILIGLKRGHIPRNVPTGERVLNLDHFSAEVQQLERGPRAGPKLLEGEHTHVL